jgi:TPR repeat protein
MRMARCYRLGIGVEKSREKEEEWLLKAAMKDSPEAQVMLGDFYAERKDDPVSCANALRWYQAGAEHGYAPAARKLATCYSTGSLGVRRDTDLAMEFSREKAGIVQPVRDALREFGFAD